MSGCLEICDGSLKCAGYLTAGATVLSAIVTAGCAAETAFYALVSKVSSLMAHLFCNFEMFVMGEVAGWYAWASLPIVVSAGLVTGVFGAAFLATCCARKVISCLTNEKAHQKPCFGNKKSCQLL